MLRKCLTILAHIYPYNIPYQGVLSFIHGRTTIFYLLVLPVITH